jgi:hypothetical protein
MTYEFRLALCSASDLCLLPMGPVGVIREEFGYLIECLIQNRTIAVALKGKGTTFSRAVASLKGALFGTAASRALPIRPSTLFVACAPSQ